MSDSRTSVPTETQTQTASAHSGHDGRDGHVVTAVLVAHDGLRWLPRTLTGLAEQSRPPDRLLAVDTGSRDGTADLLADELGGAAVLTARRDAGFGEAVRLALTESHETSPPRPAPPGRVVEWVWLLHDDAAPDRTALRRLLDTVEDMPSVGVVGPKLRGWYDRRHLLEMGVTIAGSGRRETGLERREQDQGQHDGVRDVLAVSTAGMLVRRDVWDDLDGLDPELSLFRDDVDFGWRANLAGHRVVVTSEAVFHHAEATARERRPVDAGLHRPHLTDRRNALFLLLANVPAATLPWTVLRLVVGSLARSVGYLLAKLPGFAVDELLAVAVVMARPDRVLSARRMRTGTRRLPARAVRPLLAPRGAHLRQALEGLGGAPGGGQQAEPSGRHRAVESGPTSPETDEITPPGAAVWRHVVTRPGVLFAVALTLLTLASTRGLYGAGRLVGGALLPAPDGARDLWETYAASWHDVGIGSATSAPPYLGVVALVATVLLGKAGLAVDVLLLGAVPLAGITAYAAAGRVTRSALLRVWGAATYALLPALTGSVAAGRLGTAVAIVLLPLVGLGAARVVGAPGSPGPYRTAFATGLALAATAAFVPLAYLIGLALGLVAAATVLRSVPGLLRILAVLVVPPLLLLPWTAAVVRDPSLLLLEAGIPGPGLSDPRLQPLAVALLHPSGPGMYPVWISAGLVLAALAALLRRTRRGLVLAGWVVALTGVAAGLLVSRTDVAGPAVARAVAGWPGFPTAVAGAGLVVAALVGAEGARRRLARTSFGLRQPVVAVVVAVAAAVPLFAGGWWLADGVDGPLRRREPGLLPAYVAADAVTAEHPRTLVLRSGPGGRLAYTVLRDDGPRLGDAETAPGQETYQPLDGVVADLGSGRGGDEAHRLTRYAVQYVLVARPVDAALARRLDAVPGLARISAPGGAALWRIDSPAARLRIDDSDGSTTQTLPSGRVAADADVPAGPAGRLLVLAERADDGWHASLDGRDLPPRSYDGWAQAFALPGEAGQLRLRHTAPGHAAGRWLQALLIVVVVVLALPGGRRPDQDEVDSTPPGGVRRPDVEPAPRTLAGRSTS